VTDPNGKVLVGDCTQCKAQHARKVKADQADAQKIDSEESESELDGNTPDNCCLRRLLSMQEDFRSQKCLIQLVCPMRSSDLLSIFIIP
jgi:hypothetical protein